MRLRWPRRGDLTNTLFLSLSRFHAFFFFTRGNIFRESWLCVYSTSVLLGIRGVYFGSLHLYLEYQVLRYLRLAGCVSFQFYYILLQLVTIPLIFMYFSFPSKNLVIHLDSIIQPSHTAITHCPSKTSPTRFPPTTFPQPPLQTTLYSSTSLPLTMDRLLTQSNPT